MMPTIPCESQPPILNSNASTDNSLHTSVPTLPSEDFILPSTSDRVENLSTEIQPPVPLLDTSPTTSSSQPSYSKVANKNSKHPLTSAKYEVDSHAKRHAVFRRPSINSKDEDIIHKAFMDHTTTSQVSAQTDQRLHRYGLSAW
ncbi:hypothetical protein TNCV_321411 [Trichonephila clavipes]|nr:hypothetical protein TNCV_321411 [Trichonephila clavipes]